MTETNDPNQDTSTSGLGERRRRREAERARARAGGQALDPPLSRRERRARDEALASGALMLGPEGLVPTGEFKALADPQAAPTQDEPRPTPDQSDAAPAVSEPQASTESPDQFPNTRAGRRARRAAQAAQAAGEPAATAEAPSAASAPSTGSAADVQDEQEPAHRGAEGALAREVEQAPSDEAEQDRVEGAAEASSSRAITRRSLRAKQAQAPPPAQMPAEEPQRRTGTGLRPVVRPPAAASGTRSVDQSTGGLTAIQRAVRDANTSGTGIPAQEPGQESDSPASWGSAVDLPTVTDDVSDPGTDQTRAMPAVDRISTRLDGPQTPTAAPEPPGGAWQGEQSPATAQEPQDATSETSAPASPSTAASAASAPSAASAASVPSAPSPADTSPDRHTEQSAPSAPSPEAEDTGAFDMKPRWESLLNGSEAPTPEPLETQPAAAPPRRVSARPVTTSEPEAAGPTAPDEEPVFAQDPEEDDLEEEARKTPKWLFALQMLVLVLVAIILGALVYQLGWGDLFDDEGALAVGSALRTAHPWSA